MSRAMAAWVPRQHGAWAMVLAPVTTGAITAGFAPRHLLLIAFWLAGYLAFMAARGWWRARRDPAAWRPATLTYAAIAAALGLALAVPQPRLLLWVPVFALLVGLSALAVTRRRERTAANDAVMIAASALMAVVAAGVAPSPVTPSAAPAFLPPGADSVTAWLTAAVMGGYFGGTIFYVKTMIRERGHRPWYVASLVYHAVAVLLGTLVTPWVGAVGLVALARAAVVPRVWPQAQPVFIGVGEIALTVVVAAVVCLTL